MIMVNLNERSYPIVVSSRKKEFISYLENIKKEQMIVIITDRNVAGYYLKLLETFFVKMGCNVISYILEPGEETKNLNVVSQIYEFLNEKRIKKNDILIAFGGGVIGDITGFVAATYLRGINFVQIPTTLLAQVDSSVGGKVGVNFMNVKNLIGTFYQPNMVLINPHFLNTLPIRQIKVGLAEIIVHCIIADEAFFNYMEQHLDALFSYNKEVFEYVIEKNCLIKSRIVTIDEIDTGKRKILNFGHTIGHAIESTSEFSLSHGESISIGTIGAFLLAIKLGIVKEGEMERVLNIFFKIGLPTCIENLEIEKVYERMLYDKKAEQDGLLFILPIKIGEVRQVKITDKKLVLQVLNELIKINKIK